MNDKTKPIRVAIIGGGVGGVTAAYYLSSPELEGKFDVTLYQEGWRLGGKCATGRNAGADQRVQEHGIHILLGFYENAFRTFRACIEEWTNKPANYQTFEDYFKPTFQISLADNVEIAGVKRWYPWSLSLPPMPGSPGDGSPPPSIWADLKAMFGWLAGHLRDAMRNDFRSKEVQRDSPFAAVRAVAAPYLREFGDTHPSLKDVLALCHVLTREPRTLAPDEENGLRHALQDVQHWLNTEFERLDADIGEDVDETHVELHRIYYLACLGIAFARGYVGDVVLGGPNAIDDLNEVEFRDWLVTHGLPESLTWCAPIRALYDLAFAYPGGDASEQSAALAAGTTIQTALRMTTHYKGAPLWSMAIGTGDTLFSPMYEVLSKQRGVSFEFFYRLVNIGIEDDEITQLEFWQQAAPLGGTYDPLEPVNGYPCWPSEPLWQKLENGEALKRAGYNFESQHCDHHVCKPTLTRGDDFDFVILATSIAGVPAFGGPLNNNPIWRAMLAEVPTVETTATQLWLTEPLTELGWTSGPTVMTAYAEPYDSWGDFSYVYKVSPWPRNTPKLSIQYFCGVTPDGATAETAEANFRSWASSHIETLWPNVSGLEALEALLFPFGGERGRLSTQYFRADADMPAERYVLSPPHSIKHRLEADNSGYKNLFLAGDWIRTQIDGGAVEAAVEGGMRAARAICGLPKDIARL